MSVRCPGKDSWLVASALFAVVASLLAGLLVKLDLPGLERMPDSGIVIVNPGSNAQVRRVLASSETTPLAQQAKWPAGAGAQFHFEMDGQTNAGRSTVIYIPRLAGAAKLSLNGVLIATSQTSVGPLVAILNGKVMQPTGNRIDIVQDAAPNGIGIGGIYLALGKSGASSVSRIELFRGKLAQALQIAGWIGLFASFAGLLLGAHRLAFGAGITIAASLLLPAMVPAFRNLRIDAFTPHSLLVGLVLLAGCIFIYSLRRLSGPLGVFCIALGLLCISAPVAMIVARFTGGTLSETLPMELYAQACLFLFLALGMTCLLFVESLQLLRSFRETKVTVKQQEIVIAEQEMALHVQISEKAVLQERQRFVRDIHDGIGGQLLSLLLRARSGVLQMTEVEDEVQRGLTDLRLVIDSMDQIGSDLEGALAVFNTRSRQQLEAANISVHWHQADELGTYSLDARQILSLYRILQEAVSNSVRHSKANRLEVSVHPAAGSGALEITISDNGKGFDGVSNTAGKGMQNMRARAAQLGADLQWDTSEHGTIVRLDLPASTET